MSKRQDRQGSRTPAELERKYDFKKRFEENEQSVKKLDEKLNDQEIFNRLTNNGRSQGLFRGDDGNIYVNATYLVTGILASKDGKSFYLDLDNGILKGQFSEFSVSGKSVDTIAKENADSAQKAAEKYADNAVASQSQEDVFNKLTDGGNAEGIYFKDGQLYLNATYIATGVIQSTDGTSFYSNLDTGELRGNFAAFSFMGKTASWKDNGDGTYLLIGTDSVLE